MMRPLMYAVAFLFLFTGCESTEDEFTCPEPYSGALTAEEELLTGVWSLTTLEGAMEVDLTNDLEENPSTDLLGQLDECSSDVRYVFENTRAASYVTSEKIGDVCEEQKLFDGTWKYEGNIVSLIGGCAALALEIELDEEGSAFSFTSFENVRNFRGEVFPMEVTYIFTKEIEEN